jgi:hypothetical protein
MQAASNRIPNPITKKKVLAVEGPIDGCFFNALRRYLRLKDCQIVQMEGKYPLTDKIEGIAKTSGFLNVTDLGIAVDADNNYAGTFQSICAALRNSNLAVPAAPCIKVNGNPSVLVYILPRTNSNGALEDLLLSSVQNDPAIPCVTAYFQCLTTHNIVPKHNSKAKVHAFLASRKKPYLNCGEAANAKYWNFADAVFDELKTFLSSL